MRSSEKRNYCEVVVQVEVVEHALPGSTLMGLLANDIKWMGGFEGWCLLGGHYISYIYNTI